MDEDRRYRMDTETILDFFTCEEILGEGKYYAVDQQGYTEFPAIWYLDESLYIDILEDEYDLVIGNQEWNSLCLKKLEIILARYAVEEGFIDRDEFLTRMDEMLGRNIGVIPEEYRGNDYGDDEE